MTQETTTPVAQSLALAPSAFDVVPLAPQEGLSPVDLSRFDDASRQKITAIVNRTPRLDGATVNSYGMAPQAQANKYLDALLEGIRTSDVGAEGDLVAQLATGVKMLNIPGMRREAEGRDFLGSLPLIGKYFSAFRQFKARYEEINKHFARIEAAGNTQMATLSAMDSKLDGLVTTNISNMREIELYVAAGLAIAQRERDRFATQRDEALRERDPTKIAIVRDLGDQINGFETRLMRLQMASTDALLSIPQTRLTQSAGRIEYRNIVDALLFDMPRLKSAVLRVAALKRITDSANMSDARKKLAAEMADAGVEALSTAFERAKGSEAGAIAEITLMGQMADKIIGIVEKGAQIDERNRESRREAMSLLASTKDKFVDGMGQATALAVQNIR